jgi:hypothetical protein
MRHSRHSSVWVGSRSRAPSRCRQWRRTGGAVELVVQLVGHERDAEQLAVRVLERRAGFRPWFTMVCV